MTTQNTTPIRADLSQSGWLFKHPDCKVGWPLEWGMGTDKIDPIIFQFVKEDLLLNPSDTTEAVTILQKLEPYVKHIRISDGETFDFLIFSSRNKFLGLFESLHVDNWKDEDMWASIELVDRPEWEQVCKLGGFRILGKIDTSAAYDPKIYILPEQAEFIKQFKEDFDPYISANPFDKFSGVGQNRSDEVLGRFAQPVKVGFFQGLNEVSEMTTPERTVENMSIFEVKDILKSQPGMYRAIPKVLTEEERESLTRRGLIEMYDFFGAHADVICSRIETTMGLYTASEGLEPYTPEVIDQVTIIWADHLKRGNVITLTEAIDELKSRYIKFSESLSPKVLERCMFLTGYLNPFDTNVIDNDRFFKDIDTGFSEEEENEYFIELCRVIGFDLMQFVTLTEWVRRKPIRKDTNVFRFGVTNPFPSTIEMIKNMLEKSKASAILSIEEIDGPYIMPSVDFVFTRGVISSPESQIFDILTELFNLTYAEFEMY